VDFTLAQLQEAGNEYLPGLLGIEFDGAEEGIVRARMNLEQKHFAPNGYVHAAAVVALAACSRSRRVARASRRSS
jgi:acyl-coenzyme A thioesterase PaaI-like protein